MRKLIAGNWKMNGLRADGAALARDLVSRAAKSPPSCDLLVCPPATLLAEIGSLLAGSRIALGGQDCHAEPKGAHTGDVSAPMLKDAGCAYVIVGHSERRQNHHESDATVRAKATAGAGRRPHSHCLRRRDRGAARRKTASFSLRRTDSGLAARDRRRGPTRRRL